MKPEPSEELLSAYLDGAATPDERRAVENWLEQSPAARRTLNEFGRLSSALRSLPRHEVPPEFAAQVLKTVERTMLLPAQATVSTGGRAGRARSSHSRWLTMAAPFGAIAALLAFAFLLGPRMNVQQEAGLADRTRPPADSQELALGDAGGAAPAMTSTPAPDMVDEAADADNARAVANAPARGRSKPGPNESGLAGAAITPSATKYGDSSTSFPVELKLTKDDVGTFKEVIRKNAAGQVAILRVIVFDKEQGYLAVQEALQLQAVAADTPTDPADKAREVKSAPAAPAANGNMAILVQATEQQIVDTFLALVERNKKQDTVVEMRMDEPLELAAMNDDVRQMVESYEAAQGPVEPAGALGKTSAAREAVASGRAEGAGNAAKKENAPAAAATRPQPAEQAEPPKSSIADKSSRRVAPSNPAKVSQTDEESVASRQTTISWPPTAGNQRPGGVVSLRSATPESKTRGVARGSSPTADDRSAGAAAPPAQRMAKLREPSGRQVFIVIEQLDPAAKKPAAAPTSTQPDGAS